MSADLLLRGLGFEAGSRHCRGCRMQRRRGYCALFDSPPDWVNEYGLWLERDGYGPEFFRCQPCLDAERAAGEMEETLATLVYWHDQRNGHIDESWWEAAREIVKARKP